LNYTKNRNRIIAEAFAKSEKRRPMRTIALFMIITLILYVCFMIVALAELRHGDELLSDKPHTVPQNLPK